MSKKPVLTLIALVTIVGLLSACNAGQTESPVDTPPVATQAQPTSPPKTPTATPAPLTRPAAVKYHLVYDPDLQKILLIGSLNTNRDMWSFDVAGLELTRLPDKPAITVQCLDYHTRARGVITYGLLSGATWLFQSKENEWTELAKGLVDSSMGGVDTDGYPCFIAYASGADKIVSSLGNDTSIYDYSTNTWTHHKLDPHPGINAGPMAYDSESDRILEWEALVPKNMWALDANAVSWEKLTYTGGPKKGGYLAAMAYVPDLDRTFVYYLNQFNAYDYNTNTWEQAKGELKPGSRIMHSMAYDPVAKTLVMYGGRDENGTKIFDDLWLYDLQTGEWTEQPLP